MKLEMQSLEYKRIIDGIKFLKSRFYEKVTENVVKTVLYFGYIFLERKQERTFFYCGSIKKREQLTCKMI